MLDNKVNINKVFALDGKNCCRVVIVDLYGEIKANHHFIR